MYFYSHHGQERLKLYLQRLNCALHCVDFSFGGLQGLSAYGNLFFQGLGLQTSFDPCNWLVK